MLRPRHHHNSRRIVFGVIIVALFSILNLQLTFRFPFLWEEDDETTALSPALQKNCSETSSIICHLIPRVVFLNENLFSIQATTSSNLSLRNHAAREEADEELFANISNTNESDDHFHRADGDGLSDDCVWNEWQTVHHPTCNDAHTLSMQQLVIAGSEILEQLGAFTSGFDATIRKVERGHRAYSTNSSRRSSSTHNAYAFGLLAFVSGGKRIAGLLTASSGLVGGERGGSDEVLFLAYKTQRTDSLGSDLFHLLSKAHTEAMISDTFPESTTRIFGHCGTFSLTELGMSLSRTMKSMLEPLQKLSFSVQIARAVAALHHRQSTPVIYRDFSSSNAVLVNGHEIKLIDFDNALLVPEQRGTPHNNPGNETMRSCYPRVGAPFPFIESMPLEWIKGQREIISEKIDVYGLGAMLFYFLTDGAVIYHCENPKRICNYYRKNQNSISQNDVLVLKENGTLPLLPTRVQTSDDPAIQAIREAMNAALQKNPFERPTAQEIFQRLEHAYGELK